MGLSLSAKHLNSNAVSTLAALLAVTAEDTEVQDGKANGADVVARAAGQTFVVAVTEASSAGPIAAHADRAAAAAKAIRKGGPRVSSR